MSFPEKSSEYASLTSITGEWGIAYGPVKSRRLGSSLCVNLLGSMKICSFDCPYCELGQTQIRMNQLKQELSFPSVTEVDLSLRVRLRELLVEQQTIDTLTISGNGEPTLHPEFLECVEKVISARDEILPKTKIVVLTNGAHCDNKRVVHGLNLVDERIVKIDAGNEHTFKAINQPLVRANLSKITSGARKLKDITVQSMFVQGVVDNTALEDIEEWLEIVGIVQPRGVQIYTLDRIPAIPGLKKADEDTLYTIASRLKRKLQIEALVFP
jgi:wyosine [tRNA(Phe)-imidazoG37] synthetase (radical SAM superfamily)